jgi:hypothetical protein
MAKRLWTSRASKTPAAIAATNATVRRESEDKHAMAGPGQYPASPHPTPKTAAPATRAASTDRFAGRSMRDASQGLAPGLLARSAKTACVAIAPAIGQIEEADDLSGLRHSGDAQSDAERHSGRESGDGRLHGDTPDEEPAPST